MKLDNSKIHLKGKVWKKKKKSLSRRGAQTFVPRLYLKSDALPTELFHQMISYGQVLVRHSHLILFLEMTKKITLSRYTLFSGFLKLLF